MSKYEPLFNNTNKITNLVAEIGELVGRISYVEKKNINLRRENRLKTIHSSLAIENNTLSLNQVTAIIDGKRILGNPNEIKEVQNAYEVYEKMISLDPLKIEDLLLAHKTMTQGLIRENGIFRTGGVGVFEGSNLVHMAPPANLVHGLIEELFTWYKQSEMHILVKSCIFHYEFEFIHPFEDGNGRIGRMWHSMLLGQWNKIFYWLPIEELILSRQKEYYEAFEIGNKKGYCKNFVELMLEIILESLLELESIESDQDNDQDNDQVEKEIQKLLNALGQETLSALEIMDRLGMSHRPTFRKNYLNPALEKGLIERTIPDKPNSKNQKYKKI